MSFFSKLLSIKGLKRVALFAWENMPEEERLAMLDHLCRKVGLDMPSTITSTLGSTLYRSLPTPEEPPK
jgi:hypothetical protein